MTDASAARLPRAASPALARPPMRGLRAHLAPPLAGHSLCRPGLRRCWVARVRSVCLPLTGHPHKAVAQEIEVGPAKHLALEHLEAVDVPFFFFKQKTAYEMPK